MKPVWTRWLTHLQQYLLDHVTISSIQYGEANNLHNIFWFAVGNPQSVTQGHCQELYEDEACIYLQNLMSSEQVLGELVCLCWVLWPSQPIWVMSSMVSLAYHTFSCAGLVFLVVNQYCAHSFARNWQLPFLNQRKGENDRRKYFRVNLGSNAWLPDLQMNAHLTEP